MITDLKNFWQRLQTGVEIAVAGPSPDKLLGVRDGFLRYFHDGLDRTVSVAVVPQQVQEDPLGLPVSDEEVIGRRGDSFSIGSFFLKEHERARA